MRHFYDLEFLEDGVTIDFISIGIVAEDGREYYAVSNELANHPWRPVKGRLARRVRKHKWLMDNVVPSLPQPHGDWRLHMPKSWLFDFYSPVVRSPERIAEEVAAFLLKDGEPELWAYYGAYDHVRLNQLWGSMIDHPEGIPMWTNDLMQEWLRLGKPEMPEQPEGLHNALADARHNKVRFEFLQSVAAAAR